MNNVNLEDIKFALDVGTRSVIGTVGIIKDDKYNVLFEKYIEHEERAMIDGQIHDINLVAKGVKQIVDEIEEKLNIKLKEVSIAAAGRFLKTINSNGYMELNDEEEIHKEDVRKLEIIALKEAEKIVNKNTDGKLYCVGYSVKSYFLNGYHISNLAGHKGENAGIEVIATFLPRSVVDSLYTVVKKVGLTVSNLTLEPIAAIEAVVPKNLRLLNIALVDIGAGTSDIAISSKDTIASYGMVPQAGDEVTEVIVQECLVDFNTAEEIKRKLMTEEYVTYTDILGLENTVESENIKKSIRPIVTKIAEGIAAKILELNGSKAPSALFLVGGGAHTPFIIEELAGKLNMPIQRIAIKDRKSVVECISDNNLGSAGVTVLGIALVALKNGKKNFIDVTLNGSTVSLFNSHNHTVMDVIMQAGINPSMLISKNGKNLRYKLNGVKRIAFGEKGRNSIIKVNGNIESLEKNIKSEDNIEITYAIPGKDGKAKIIDLIKNLNCISIYIDNNITNLEPIVIVNNKEECGNYIIVENDDVAIINPNTIGDIKKYIIKDENIIIKKDNFLLEDNYEVKEGEKIITFNNLETEKKEIVEEVTEGILEETIKEAACDKQNDGEKEAIEHKEEGITVTFNNKKLTLSKQKDYIIVDIFNYIDFDTRSVKGTVNLILNGEKVGYTEKIKDGDKIELFFD